MARKRVSKEAIEALRIELENLPPVEPDDYDLEEGLNLISRQIREAMEKGYSPQAIAQKARANGVKAPLRDIKNALPMKPVGKAKTTAAKQKETETKPSGDAKTAPPASTIAPSALHQGTDPSKSTI